MNQHVSSFAYPRLFEEAALRRLAALGVSAPGLSRSVEIGYRKPFVAGDRARILLRAFRLGEQLGAVGTFVRETDDVSQNKESAHCYLQVVFAA
jgi:acyl-CoA thioesterase FadM